MKLNEQESMVSSIPLKERGLPEQTVGLCPSLVTDQWHILLMFLLPPWGLCPGPLQSLLSFLTHLFSFCLAFLKPIHYSNSLSSWLGSLRSGKTHTLILKGGFHLGLVPCWHLFCPSTSKLLLLPKHSSSQHSETPMRPHLHLGNTVFHIKLILWGVRW